MSGRSSSVTGPRPKGLPDAQFFPSREKLRAWFLANHDRATEIWIAYPKATSDRPGLSYPEVLDEALCFGWVDGQVRSLGPEAYANRYTPRRPGSHWSRTNIAKVEELRAAGRMHAAGLAAFERRAK